MGFNDEKFDFLLGEDTQSFGIEMYEPMGDNTTTGCNAVCVQSTFKFELYNDGVLVDDTVTYSPPDNQDAFFGFWSPKKFDEVRIREIVGTNDNEFFGRFYYQDSSCKPQTCNGNGVCDAGESCNCGDCTNGGADDKDKCGLTSTGGQMLCTKDIDGTTTNASDTEKWIAYTYPGAA